VGAKKYINALLYVFIASGVLAGFLWAIRAGFWSGLQFGFLFAIGSTVFVALVILPLDFFFTKNSSNKELDVSQNQELKLTGNVGDVFQRSLRLGNYAIEPTGTDFVPSRFFLCVRAVLRHDLYLAVPYNETRS
jgi:hypothetical protein